MKLKIPKIKKSYKKEGMKINPSLFWRIIVIAFFVFFAGSFYFGWYLYKEMAKQNISTFENTSEKTEKEKKEKINRVLEYFANREKKSAEIINTSSSIIDPSL